MRATTSLLRQSIRLTLFTRRNCPLCDDAKEVMDKVKQRRPFEYHEVNVMGRGQGRWRELYQYETPVVHVDAAEEGNADFETTESARKLMHRFTESQLEEAMDKAGEEASQQ